MSVQRVGKADKEDSSITPGLPEQDSAGDPTARSSHEPELPAAQEADSDLDELPELSESVGGDASSTVDYRDCGEESDQDEDWDLHTLLSGDSSHAELLLQDLGSHLEEFGTKAKYGPIELLD